MKLRHLISNFVATFTRRFGHAPERQVVQRAFANEATVDVNACLDQLERNGFLSLSGEERPTALQNAASLRPMPRIPVRGFRAANLQTAQLEPGFGSLIMNLEGVGYPSPEETYALQVPDDSMIGAGLRPGDFAIIANHAGPRSGDIAVVRQKEKFVLRRYVLIARIPHLLAEHPTNPQLTLAFDAQFEGVLWASLQINPSQRRLHRPAASRVRYSDGAGLTLAWMSPPFSENLRQPPLTHAGPETGAQRTAQSRDRASRSAGKLKNACQKAFLVDPGHGLPKYGLNESIPDFPSADVRQTLAKGSAKEQSGDLPRGKVARKPTRRKA